MKLCLPCFPSSAAQNFDDQPPKKEADLANITIPDASDYAGIAAREFLSVLEAVAQQVPVPGFSSIVSVAANIIKACDDSKATLARAEDLKIRIKTLVAVFVNELKGKKKEEIHAKLLQDIESMKRDMDHIQKTLEKISSQHCLLLVFFRGINDDRVNECVIKLNNSLESFNVARNIDFTDMLNKLEQQITAFYNQQQEALRVLQQGMDRVIDMLNERGFDNTSSLPSRASIPAKSSIFHGRDQLVAELSEIIKNPALHKHICILGPGGMGKTSVSLAVMDDPGIKSCFADHLRVWVPCVKATSVSIFLDTLCSSLAIIRRDGDLRSNILAELKSSSPIIMVLDNFETPWNVEGAQSEVEHILQDICQIPHVTVFLTMRSSTVPCGDLSWHQVNLGAVDVAASHKIYASWYPEASDNEADLDFLLNAIGHMPLAIKLIAKFAQLGCLSAREALGEYKKVGTSIMEHGSDSESNMDICIGLSVYSPRIKAHPAAFHLLCVLAMLPTGTTHLMISKWWSRDIPNWIKALGLLKDTSLIEQHGSIYFILPVIQRYILNPSRFDDNIRIYMIKIVCMFLKQHKSKIGDPLYQTHVAAISAEEANFKAILLQTTERDPDIPYVLQNGHLLLAQYQVNNKPDQDIITHSLLLLDCLEGMGLAWIKLEKIEDAHKAFQQALLWKPYFAKTRLLLRPNVGVEADVNRCHYLLNRHNNPGLKLRVNDFGEGRLKRLYSEKHAFEIFGLYEVI
ncbi:hypothetical protein H0H92_015220 [Tricholoma furcatifolium]|nr:hypothetical protein H0H92_015220 [Tricholoma furcatifolium]